MGRVKNKIYLKFAFSFLITLCLPIMSFAYIFMQSYREVYRDRIIQQAEDSLSATGMELDRYIDSLWRVSFSDNLSNDIKKAVLNESDYYATEARGRLQESRATHYIVKEVCYYNEAQPDVVYLSTGTCSLSYYARIYAGMEDGEQLLEELESVDRAGWAVWRGGMSLQYVIKTEYGDYWIFIISEKDLEYMLFGYDSYITLNDYGGKLLFSAGHPEMERYYEIDFDSPNHYFRLTRRIDEDSLFAELNTLQGSFFLVSLLLLLIGGVLTLILTYYNGYPFRKLLEFSREKVMDIPKDMGGLEAFQFALKSMEEQISLSESRQRKNRLLLHLLYGRDCDTEYFRTALKEEGLFGRVECYRVIIVTSAAVAGVADLSKIEFYINMMEKTEYEFRLIDMPNKDAAVIIVGMREAVEEKLGQELRRMANVIENSTGEKVCFYVGGKYRELGRIYSSYAQACACIREEGERKGGQIVYYNSERKKEGNPPYPKAELNALYDALTGAELYEAFAVTDRLLDILKEYQNNRFASITLYYDVLNTYYRAWAKLDIDMESEFLETDLLEIRDNLEAIQILQRIREQYAAYVGRIRGKDSDGSSDDKRRSRSQVKKTEEAKKDDLILRIVSFIDENRKSCDLCVSMVADYFNMSISHMSHKFKKQMNRTISDYITEKKFDYVRELLLETDYSIKEISFMAGYSHPVSFIYKFRQLYGMTPVEYRTANKKI